MARQVYYVTLAITIDDEKIGPRGVGHPADWLWDQLIEEECTVVAVAGPEAAPPPK